MTGGGSSEARVRACPGVHAVELDDEVLIWDPRAEQLHRLNPTATRIWRAFSRWRTRPDVATELSAHADVPRSEVERDVTQFVEHLSTAGLLEFER